MEHYLNNATHVLQLVNGSHLQELYTKRVVSSGHSTLYLNVIELLVATVGLLINFHLIWSIVATSKVPHRTFSLSLLNLSLGQSLVCASSLVVAVGTLLSDDPISPSTALITWQSLMQNVAVGFFCGLCLSGTAVLTWTHWWFATNINPCQWLTSSIWEKVVAIVLWAVAILLTARLQLADTSILSLKFDGRVVASYSTIYCIVFFLAGGVVLISSSTVISFIPHRFTLRKMQPTPVSITGHECGADCPCSDSETLSPDFRRIRKERSIHSAPNQSHTVSPTWPEEVKVATKSTRSHSAEYLTLPFQKNQNKDDNPLVILTEAATADFISEKNEAESELISDGISVSSSDHLADGSSSCSPLKMLEAGHKLPQRKLQERLIQLNSIRQIRPESPPSPKADSVHTFRSYQRRRKEIRQPRTGFRLITKKPNRIQRIAISVFIGCYLPPLILFVVANWSNLHAAILMGFNRLLFDLVNCINPYFCCVQYPSLRLRMHLLRRKIHPLTNGY